MDSPSHIRTELLIERRTGITGVSWTELWRHRELLWMLASRDIKVRYKQTVMGAAWAILQPLITMVVFAVLFAALLGRGNQPSPDGIPYAVSTYCGLLPWQLFAYALTHSSNSLISNERLISKIYFPRLIIPLSSVIAGLVDFCLAFVVLILMMLFYQVTPTIALLSTPLFLLLALFSALAAGLWLAALNAMYRDVRHTVPFIIQIGLFITPVLYSAETVLRSQPGWARALYMLNPMAGAIEGFRWGLLGGPAPSFQVLGLSCVSVAIVLLTGILYFRHVERTLADWI